MPSNGVYEKDENKQIRVDGLDNARMLLHTCATHSKGIGLNSKHEDLPVSRLHDANPAALIQAKLHLMLSRFGVRLQVRRVDIMMLAAGV